MWIIGLKDVNLNDETESPRSSGSQSIDDDGYINVPTLMDDNPLIYLHPLLTVAHDPRYIINGRFAISILHFREKSQKHYLIVHSLGEETLTEFPVSATGPILPIHLTLQV
ncbi:hypothetical protein AVEN_218752-1 [Araneus ventricosus]|uniref:Uncharacterized protein n=1 Tax=Araneus ventricosus TaxID=182803 RepID=A0A4Y2B4S8_ARAVE|nr:hypothetical protein AVEN_218752-1 [Araneus ventricosus]